MRVPAVSAVATEPDTNRALGWVLVVWSIVTSGVALFGLPVPLGGVIAIALLVTAGAAVVRFDFAHPYVWCGAAFFLYHASVPILFLAGLWPRSDALREVGFVSWSGLAAFMLAVGPARVSWRALPGPDDFRVFVTWSLATVSFVVTGLYVWAILRGGYTSKEEIALGSSLLLRLDPAYSVLTLCLAIIVGGQLQSGRIPLGLMALSFLWFGLAFAIGGERDLVLRLAWVFVFIWHVTYRRLSKGAWLVVGLVAALMINVLADLKNVLVRDVGDDPTVSDVTRLASLYPDEFVTASDNLQRLISEGPWPKFYGKTLLWDARQAIGVGFLGSTPGPAPTALFNAHFFPEIVSAGGGRGFSLVGEGYMNFGTAGAVIWLALLGLLAGVLYRKASGGLMWVAVYALSMPLFVYVMRADFSNLMSQGMKHILLPAGLILASAEVVRRATNQESIAGP
ncbi:MAG: O-antigen polymerase [Gemmatimonadales bacterium]